MAEDRAALLERAGAQLRARTRAGARRVWVSLPKIILGTAGAVFSYWFAEHVFGHSQPIFAATSSLIALNFASSSHIRRTLEVAIGCTLGIAVADLLMQLIGRGLWQATVVLFVSLVLSRFLDSGVVFSIQFGLQSLLAVLLPLNEGGPFARSLDAVLGGSVALLLMVLWPADPRRAPAKNLARLLREVAGQLRDLATALRRDDGALAWHTLVRARASQPLVDAAHQEINAARETVRLNPLSRNRREDIEALGNVHHEADLAVRGLRVLARRIATLMSNNALDPTARDDVADMLEGMADGVGLLGVAVNEPSEAGTRYGRRRARERLMEVAANLNPDRVNDEDPQFTATVMLMRSLTVDLMVASGIPHDDAVRYLPRI